MHHSKNLMSHNKNPMSRNESEFARSSGKELQSMGSEGNPLLKLRLLCLSTGPTGILELGRMLRKRDEDGNKNLNFDKFIESFEEAGLDMEVSDLAEVFVYFDKECKGSINIDEFLDHLRPPMPDSRLKIIEKCFKMLDENGDGHLTVENLRKVFSISSDSRYISGEDDLEPMFQKFLAHFDDDKLETGIVTREEFLNYYASVSASIDDDCYFDLMMRNAFKLKQCQKNPMTRIESDLANKSIRELQSVGSEGNPIDKLRLLCLSTGATGILILGRTLRKMDTDETKKINLEKFILCIRETGMDINISDATQVFHYLDPNNEGHISIDELLEEVRPPMSDSRKNIIDASFKKMDTNNDGNLTVANLRRVFSVQSSSRYISGEDDQETMFQKFLVHFDKEQTENGIITKEEFLNYYAGVSASIDNDCYFDLMMRNTYKL